MALRDYLTGEVAEDWVDGLIPRREALRRLTLLGLSVSSSAALLAACAAERATSGAPGTGPATPGATSASAGASPTAASSASAATPSASAVASSSPAGATPGAASPPVAGSAITFAGPRGELQGFLPTASTARGAMLVIHENRGLTDHIRSVASRLAGDGYTSIAIDLLSEEGGTAAVGDSGQVGSILGGASTERLVGDMKAGLDELARRAPGAKLGIVGFCFGGGMVWTLLDAGEPRLAAAVPFYGPAPAAPDLDGNSAAVLGIYAELDGRVNASRDAARTALEAAGLAHELRTYPGVDHAFFNDTSARYDAVQAAAAYRDLLDWLGRYLGA